MDEELYSTVLYRVVVNDEEQYSVWLHDQQKPPGWRDTGKVGTKADCLDYIEAVWTDMRPLGIRKSGSPAD